ncbi:polysaccharide deacetylase family protein [Paenibacillus sp. GP183]|uniref:polysaccharide deacetylase family protein n=1 Tax=Paenibacillus sp. GP183 TaxID=1882751 RepID=UPI001C0E0985|nr:polysaccharide deacetylase family protein [Paenibacillus sp. GP183]
MIITYGVIFFSQMVLAQIIQRIEQEGHRIGNHSWDHDNLTKLPNDKVQSEINQTDALIKSRDDRKRFGYELF